MHAGTAILDFGAAADLTTDASVFVVSPGLSNTSRVHVWFQADDSVPLGTEDEHIMVASMVDLATSRCSTSGFTIHGMVREGTLSGEFTAQYRWR